MLTTMATRKLAMATSAAQLDSGGRGNQAGAVLSLRPGMFAEAVSPVVQGMSDEDRCAFVIHFSSTMASSSAHSYPLARTDR